MIYRMGLGQSETARNGSYPDLRLAIYFHQQLKQGIGFLS